MPSLGRNSSTAFWNSGSTAVIQTLKPITPAVRPAGVFARARSHPHEHRRQIADSHRLAASRAGVRRTSEPRRAPLPSSNVIATREPDGPRRRVWARRHASTCSRRGSSDSGSAGEQRRRRRAAVDRPALSSRCGRRAAAPLPLGVDLRDEQVLADQAHVEAWRAARDPRRIGRRCRRSPGSTAKCDWPSRPSMSRSTARSSPTVRAAAAFGPELGAARRPSRRRSASCRSESRGRSARRHRRSRPPAAPARPAERRDGADAGRQREDGSIRPRPPPTACGHFRSALIPAGSSNTDGGTRVVLHRSDA